MRRRIWKISEDRFEDKKPEITFLPEHIHQSFLWNGEKQGSFQMNVHGDASARGIVYSSSPYVQILDPEFDGTHLTIRYALSQTEFYPGDEITGFFDVVYNQGEKRIPFQFTFHKETLTSADGPIESMEDFLRLAQNDQREAIKVFYQPSFALFMEDQSEELRSLYRGYTNAIPSAQNFENFLTATGLKKPVDFEIHAEDTEIYSLQADWRGAVRFTKSNWGFLEITAESSVDFIEISHPTILDSDFLGREYTWNYVIRQEKLHAGRNEGKITFTSGRQERQITIKVSSDSEELLGINRYNPLRAERKELLFDYFDMKFGRKPVRDFSERLIRIAEHERDEDEARQEEAEGFLEAKVSPWYRLLITYGRVLMHEKQEALYLLRDLKDEIEDHYSAEWAFLLYLYTQIERDEDYVRRLREEIEKIFRLNPEDLRIFLMLLPLRPEYKEDPSLKLKAIRQWVMGGYRSPFLLYEAYEIYRRNPYLLSKIDPFSKKVLTYMYKRNAFTREIGMQLCTVMKGDEESEFDPAILRILSRAYQTYTENELLGQIIIYLIRGGKKTKEANEWYKRGIQKELRLNGLYEAYLSSLPMDSVEELPETVKLFFRYPNQLGLEQRELLYSLIVQDKSSDPRTYREYVANIDAFVREQVMLGRMNDNLAILYQNSLDHNLLTEETGRAMSRLFFLHKVLVLRPGITRVIVYEDSLIDPRIVSVQNNVAYVQLLTKDAKIFLEDAGGNRFYDKTLYMVSPMIRGEQATEEVRTFTDRPLHFFLHDYVAREDKTALRPSDLEFIEMLLSAKEIRPQFLSDLLPQIESLLKRDGREEILSRYLWEHREEPLESSDMRSLRLSYGISQGHMEDAYQLLMRVFVSKIQKNQILRLLNHQIRLNEYTSDDFLISLAAGLMMNDGYSEITVDYLNRYYTGPVEWLRKLFDLTEAERMENSELASRTLIEMLYQDENSSYPGNVYQAYLRKQPNRMVAEAFLTYWSHEYLKGGVIPDASFFGGLVRFCHVEDDPNDSCRIALMKYLCERESLSPEEFRILEGLLRYHIVRNIYFSFYQKADYSLIVKFHLYDKVFVEYHGKPGEEVTLVYHRPGQKEVQERMEEMYDGIYVREFVLFFGESVEYEIYTEGQTSPVMKDRAVGQDLLEEGHENRFQMLNRLQSDQIYGNIKELKQDMVAFDQLDQMTKDLYQSI